MPGFQRQRRTLCEGHIVYPAKDKPKAYCIYVHPDAVLRNSVGGGKNHKGTRSTSSHENVECLMGYLQAVYSLDQGVQGKTLSYGTLMVRTPDEEVAEEEVRESLK